MSPLRVLFLGGTGVISTAVVARSLALGHDVTILNRGLNQGTTTARPVPGGVRQVRGDLRDPASVDAALAAAGLDIAGLGRASLGRAEFDVVAQFMAFTPDYVQADLDRFMGRCGQYVFISSASAYQKPPARLPITESAPLRNPFWQYSRDKIACEDLLVTAYRDHGFPATIIRPSHTYDMTLIPTMGGWTDVARMRTGKPVVVHGDGTSLWTLTHADDVAVGIAGLFGNPLAHGEAFTVTGDHAPTWNQIYGWLGAAAGVEPDLVHVPSQMIAAAAPELGDGLLGDKAHSVLFDCSKLRALVPEFNPTVPYWEGAQQQIAWYDEVPERQVVDAEMDALFDRLVARATA